MREKKKKRDTKRGEKFDYREELRFLSWWDGIDLAMDSFMEDEMLFCGSMAEYRPLPAWRFMRVW